MKYLHTMLRVGNLEKSLQFYSEVLGFVEQSRQEYPKDKFTLLFLRAPGDQIDAPLLELTYNWDIAKYEIGNGYGHMAYKVTSLDVIREKLNKFNLSFSWGPNKTPSGNRSMAFLKDPDGYQIELLEYKE